MKVDVVRQEVTRILTVSPETRADDMVLYYHYIAENLKGVSGEEYLKVFANPKYRAEHGLASFASVSRMRRKLQETLEELRPSKEQLQIKAKYEKMYRDFYKNPLCLNCE